MEITFSDALEVVKWIATTALIPGFLWIKKYMQSSKDHRTNIQQGIQDLTIAVTEIKKTVNTMKIMEEANFELNPLPLFVCDNRGLCIEVNDSLLRVFNADTEDMYEYGWLSFLHPDDLPRVKATWEEGIANGSHKIKDSYRVIDRKTRLQRNPKVIAHLFSKTILKYDSDKRLEIAIGTVWSLDSKSNEEKIDCILQTMADVKKTTIWKSIEKEIDKNK